MLYIYISLPYVCVYVTNNCIFTVIIPLRDPCRVLESWFRHLSNVYEHTEGKSFLFGQADFKRFCPGSFNPAHYQMGEDYERFIAMVLSIMNLPNVCVVFYEDLLTDAKSVFARLAEFTGFGRGDSDLIEEVATLITEDGLKQEFKLEPVFSEDFIQTRERKWCENVQYSKSPLKVKNYYDMYEKITGHRYELPKFQTTIAGTKPRLSDLLFFRKGGSY